MADNKKSFLLYCDLIHTVKKLSNEQAGDLFKQILSYVNDENPIIDNVLIELVFEPIKQQLKRDLSTWEKKIAKRAEAGRLGGLKSGEVRSNLKQNEANEASASTVKQNEANEAVNVNDTVSVTVNVNDNINIIKKEAEKKKIAATNAAAERKKIFLNYVNQFMAIHPKERLLSFFNYWSEMNSSGTKMKWELEKTWELKLRLNNWADLEKKSFIKPVNQFPDRPPKPSEFHTDWNESERRWMYSPLR